MKSLIYRHTTHDKGCEATTLYVLGVPVFSEVTVYAEDRTRRRACGFQVFASDAPCSDVDDDDDNETDD